MEGALDSSGVAVADLGSANGWVLAPKHIREAVPLERMASGEFPGTTTLGWDGKVRHKAFVPLEPVS